MIKYFRCLLTRQGAQDDFQGSRNVVLSDSVASVMSFGCVFVFGRVLKHVVGGDSEATARSSDTNPPMPANKSHHRWKRVVVEAGLDILNLVREIG